MNMSYENRPQSEIKVLGETNLITKESGDVIGKILRREEYAPNKFRIVEYFYDTGELYMRSELTGGTAPNYDYRVENYYNRDGVLMKTITYHRTYNSNGTLLSEELVQ